MHIINECMFYLNDYGNAVFCIFLLVNILNKGPVLQYDYFSDQMFLVDLVLFCNN